MEKMKRFGENMDKTMIVALDAMGGDLAPVEIVKGAAFDPLYKQALELIG